MDLVSLRGRSALSPFRVAKLLAALSAATPSHRVASLTATYWHFAEVSRPLERAERATLTRLLEYGPRDSGSDDDGALLLVTPRPGTLSPWSSKATDIAHNCGLASVTRIERGVAYRVRTHERGTLDAATRETLLPLIHDRMVEAVLTDFASVPGLFEHVAPRPLTT